MQKWDGPPLSLCQVRWGWCCSYAVGRTTRRHPPTSSHILFPLHLFSSRSCHRLSTAKHRLSMLLRFPSISPSVVPRNMLSLLFQWQYLESFRCLICSKMPFSSGILIFSRIPVIMPLHWGRFLVVHQYSKFSMHPQDFLLWEIYDDF